MRLSTVFEILLVAAFIIALLAIPVLLYLNSGFLAAFFDSDLSLDFTIPEPESGPQLAPDAVRYFQLKNKSCQILAGSFLIVMDEVAEPELGGLVENIPEERIVANKILSLYAHNQTTKLYVRQDQMKLVRIAGGEEQTTLWKNGRIYECENGCTMRIMSENESAAYYDMLNGLRENCIYFAQTRLPAEADAEQLLFIENLGLVDKGIARCEQFRISANTSYAISLLESENLTQDQYALLWGLAHLNGPIYECLDESAGILVSNNLSIDLTDYYDFDYLPGGYMRVSQQSVLTYFTDNVPESFLSLPDSG